jgi:hypothetical protein
MVVTIIIINNSATAAVAARFPVFGFPTIITAKTMRRSARVFLPRFVCFHEYWLMQALGQSALPCRVKDGGASNSPWIFRIWFSDGYVRIFRWIDGILDWRWIWLWRGPQPVLESRIFVGMHATLMLAKRQRQPMIVEGKIEDQGISSILLTWMVLLFSSLPMTFTRLPMNFLAVPGSSNW